MAPEPGARAGAVLRRGRLAAAERRRRGLLLRVGFPPGARPATQQRTADRERADTDTRTGSTGYGISWFRLKFERWGFYILLSAK